MRGTPKPWQQSFCYYRITPAYAGNTLIVRQIFKLVRNHPRLCGEHFAVIDGRNVEMGSPPPMRGTHNGRNEKWIESRITPAYAGNTLCTWRSLHWHQDHPRLCGEHMSGASPQFPNIGSPPPMRGTRKLQRTYRKNIRITPAYAGNTGEYNIVTFPCKDHPRLCGEHLGIYPTPTYWLGSPPPMRGTQRKRKTIEQDSGITPAYAGNTLKQAFLKRRLQDHPRLCGEHWMRPAFRRKDVGSPPPMRGTHEDNKQFSHPSRISPAYAGNTPPVLLPSGCFKDHPRLCGEHFIRY